MIERPTNSLDIYPPLPADVRHPRHRALSGTPPSALEPCQRLSRLTSQHRHDRFAPCVRRLPATWHRAISDALQPSALLHDAAQLVAHAEDDVLAILSLIHAVS